jgi:hypothetical protein
MASAAHERLALSAGRASGHAARVRPSSSSCSPSTPPIIRPASRANVVQTAANKGVLLALVAMAQTFVVLTAGIDLSVGMVFVLTNCLASFIVIGSPRDRRSASSACLRPALGLRRAQRRHRHLRPAAADRDDHRDGRGLFRHRARAAARSGRRRQRRSLGRLDRPLYGVIPASLSCFSPVFSSSGFRSPLGDRARGLCGRVVGSRGLYVGRAGAQSQARRLRAVRAASLRSRACS